MEIIKGRVKKGRGLGRKLGFPTLNMGYDGEITGIFAGRVRVDERVFAAAVHVGPRPAVNDPEKVCEAFILDMPLDLDDDFFDQKEIEVTLIEKIREVQNFPSLDALVAQITKDVEQIRNLLK